MTHFFARNIHQGSRLAAFFLAACLLTAGFFAHAAQEKFDYDPLGRLVRVVDELGRVTNYVYDPAGNLLQVITNGTLTPPSFSSVVPNALRRGEIQSFTINGAALNGVRLAASDPDLSLTKLVTTNGQITFDLSASTGAVLGPHVFTFENSAGSAAAIVTVNPLLPSILVSPAPLAVPPDGKSRQFTVRLSNTDTLSHVVGLSTSDATIATVSPASVIIPAGATEVYANITGLKGGTTEINLVSTTLNSTKAPVFITADFVGISTSYAKLLGVLLEEVPAPVTTTFTPIVSPLLGVFFGGSYIDSISPKAIAIGSNAVPLIISGNELQAAASISVIPADGVTLGALAVAPDGKSVTAPVTVALNAPTTTRQVVLKNAAGVAYTVAKPGIDLLEIVEPGPEIYSIDPIFAMPGATAIPFVVRGKNFHDFFDLRMSPASGISIGTFPIINAGGTTLTTTISLGILAASGPRTVILETLGGVSSSTPSSANTFSVVTTVEPAVTPVTSPLLGVVLEETPTPTTTAYGIVATNVGIALGPVATSVSPTDGEIGTSVAITIQGSELSGVTAVNFAPATGLTVSALTISPDGKSLMLNLAIDASAPKTVRKVEVLAGSALIPFANPAAGQFLVTSPQPEIDSITPLYLQVGTAPTQLTVRGKNFDLAQAVKIVPPEDITVSTPPTVSADNKTLTVNISATASAVLGARSVVVVTPAGETTSTQGVANTISLASNAGSTYTPIASALLGVTLEEVPAPITALVGPIISPSLGVTLETTPIPVSTAYLQPAPNVGVALGPVATGMQPKSGLPGATTTLTISGFGLDAVTGVSVYPADGITVGAISAMPDGSQLTVSLTLATNAPAVIREIRLAQTSGKVEFSDASANRFLVAVGAPSIISITPILATQGTTFTLTIRGTNLQGTSVVQATPDMGMIFGSGPVVNADGTEVTVGVAITDIADLGPRVIQVVTPGGTSTSVAAPANTFTVYPP